MPRLRPVLSWRSRRKPGLSKTRAIRLRTTTTAMFVRFQRPSTRSPCLCRQSSVGQKNGFYHEKRFRKSHDREVLTNYVGELEQHDTSYHLWSSLSQTKWYLIAAIDDHRRISSDLKTRIANVRFWCRGRLVGEHPVKSEDIQKERFKILANMIFRKVRDRNGGKKAGHQKKKEIDVAGYSGVNSF